MPPVQGGQLPLVRLGTLGWGAGVVSQVHLFTHLSIFKETSRTSCRQSAALSAIEQTELSESLASALRGPG